MIEQEVAPWHDAARPGQRIGHEVEAHARIGSTNDRVAEILASGEREGIAVVAEEQTAGRGRRGRGWTSPPGRNLTVSIGLRPRIDARDAWQLGLAAALAVHAACAEVAVVDLKWPNDVVARDGRKTGGLLVETVLDGDRLGSAVVGVGINVNWRRSEMPDALAGRTTSLSELAGREVDRVLLLRAVLERVEVEIAEVEEGRSPLERYRAACVTLGAEVSVRTAAGVVEGVARDLDELGALVVETGRGPVVLASGEVVRVRPVGPP